MSAPVKSARYWRAFVGDEPHRKVIDQTFVSWAAARETLLGRARAELAESEGPQGCRHCAGCAEQVIDDLSGLDPDTPYRGDIGIDAVVLEPAVLP